MVLALLACLVDAAPLPTLSAGPAAGSDSWSMVVVADLPFATQHSVLYADADRDGRVEVYCNADTTRWPLYALEHVGNFTFEPIRLSRWKLTSKCIGDIDRDGLCDLVVHDQVSTGLYVYESPDSASLPLDSVWRAPGSGVTWYGVALTDVDIDSACEIAVVAAQSAVLQLYECTGDNRYDLRTSVHLAGYGSHDPAQTLDLNCNGKPELAVGCGGGCVAFYEAVDDSLGFLDTVRLLEDDVNCWASKPVSMPDLDGDGRTELLLHCYSWNRDILKLAVLESPGDDSFAVVWADTMNGGDGFDWSVAVGDVDGDSSPEFGAINGDCVRLFRCVGPDQYECFWRSDTGGWALALYDINHDGRDELIQDCGYRERMLVWTWQEVGVEERAAERLRQVEIQPSVVRSQGVIQISGMPPSAETEVVDASGRVVSSLVTGNWSTANSPSGAYFTRIRIGNQSIVRKVLVVE